MPLLLVPALWFAGELLVIILIAGQIGAWPTIGWLVSAIIIGIMLLRGQRALTLHNMQTQRADPHNMREGGFRVLAGLLLIIPGFLSDALAVVFLLPPLRVMVGALLLKWLPVERFTAHRGGTVYEHQPANDDIIEGQITEEKKKPE